MTELFSLSIIFSSIRLAVPLILAALGGLYSERAGVINIALEGLMLAGAFTAASVTYYLNSSWLGLLAGTLVGILVAAVHAIACIEFKANQVVSGIAINILFLGAPALISGALFASTGSTPHIPKENLIPIAPIIIAFLLVPLTWYILNRTPFGLHLRAVGENPEAADSVGIDVKRVRYIALLLSGALAAIGGAYLAIGQASFFTRNMSAGRGFIALAALIFGKWRPVQTMLACLLFGLAEALSIQLQGEGNIPVQFIQIIPYLLTIIVLAGFIGRAKAPQALGRAYEKERG
jgi:general nucleoside transport system permease protein